MKIKLFWLLITLQLTTFLSYAQDKNFLIGPTAKVGYEKLGAIRGVAGIIGDSYYVIENDYGGKFDFNNNIKTLVSIFSIQTGNFKKRISLNELVAQNKEVNKILFADIVVWKDKLIGFYTHKANSSTFMANAIVCEPDGRLIKDIEIGELTYNYNGTNDGMLNARKKISVVKSFQMRFSPDSSKLIVLLSAPDDKNSNIHFKVFKLGLELDKEIEVRLPLDKRSGDLINFTIDNQGVIYVLGRTEKSKSERKESNTGDYNHFFYSINTSQNNHVESQALEVHEKSIMTINMGLTAKGYPICVGFYNNSENRKARNQLHGIFTIVVSPKDFNNPKINIKPIPDSSIVTFKSERALKKGEGLDEAIRIKKLVPTRENNLFAFGTYDYVEVRAYGTTGAMNTYQQVSSALTVLFIDEDGKIIWEHIRPFHKGYKELETRVGMPEFITFQDKAKAFYCGKAEADSPYGLCYLSFDKLGFNNRLKLHSKVPEAQWFKIVENSLLAINDNEYLGLVFASDGKNTNQINVVKIINP